MRDRGRPGAARPHQLGKAAQARVRHRHADLPELRRWRTEDHRGHPGAAGDRQDLDSRRAGSTASVQGQGARGGATLRRLSRAGCRKHNAPGCNAKPQPGRRCAPCQCGAAEARVYPEHVAASALSERSRTCRISARRQHDRQIQAPLAGSTDQSAAPSRALPRVVEIPIPWRCAPAAPTSACGRWRGRA